MLRCVDGILYRIKFIGRYPDLLLNLASLLNDFTLSGVLVINVVVVKTGECVRQNSSILVCQMEVYPLLLGIASALFLHRSDIFSVRGFDTSLSEFVSPFKKVSTVFA